jgi:hypothetical protein
MNRGG